MLKLTKVFFAENDPILGKHSPLCVLFNFYEINVFPKCFSRAVSSFQAFIVGQGDQTFMLRKFLKNWREITRLFSIENDPFPKWNLKLTAIKIFENFRISFNPLIRAIFWTGSKRDKIKNEYVSVSSINLTRILN